MLDCDIRDPDGNIYYKIFCRPEEHRLELHSTNAGRRSRFSHLELKGDTSVIINAPGGCNQKLKDWLPYNLTTSGDQWYYYPIIPHLSFHI